MGCNCLLLVQSVVSQRSKHSCGSSTFQLEHLIFPTEQRLVPAICTTLFPTVVIANSFFHSTVLLTVGLHKYMYNDGYAQCSDPQTLEWGSGHRD